MPTVAPSPLRLVFAGTPDFAAHHLRALIDSPHELVGVYTQPDRPAGRGKKLQPSPVKQLALSHEVPVYQPVSLKAPAAQAELAALNADVMVVVAYGLLLPKAILDTPRLGCVNVHASLLPRWRGAAPIQRAIEAGDTESGVTIMQMDVGLDTGDMLVKAHCAIQPDDTAGALHDRLADLGAPALLKALSELSGGRTQPEPQAHDQSTYAAKITKAEAALDWSQPAATLARQVRAFNPFPISHTRPEDNSAPIRVWRASAVTDTSDAAPGTIVSVDDAAVRVACGEGVLALEVVQLPGKKALPVEELRRGRADLFQTGQRFALPESRS